MDEAFKQGLAISGVGLALVFGALLMLWALIAVMTRVRPPGQALEAEDQEVLVELQEAEPAPVPSSEEMAAIAAALVLLNAERQAEATLRWRLPPVLTRWLSVGYGRQLQPWRPPRDRRCD